MLGQLPGFIEIDCYFTVKRLRQRSASVFPSTNMPGFEPVFLLTTRPHSKSVCMLFIPYICAVTVPQQQPGYCGLKGNPV